MNEPPLLDVSGLRIWFNPGASVVRAVDRVDFRIEEGEALGLVGESGCGKTVTALAMLGLLPDPAKQIQKESAIRFRGKDLVGASEEDLRLVRGAGIAMVFQEPMVSLNPVLSVGDQIDEVFRVHAGFGRKRAREETIRLLAEVGLPNPQDLVGAPPHELSGGMRQRAAIAMALAGNPSLLIADEPTTALDVTIQAQILDLLVELRDSRSMALLLITHDLAVVSQVCDRVAVMYAGQIVEAGPVAEVFVDPRHPYTRALLLTRGETEDRRFHTIPGSVPSPSRFPVGCRFRPRCHLAFDGCGKEPAATAPAPGRMARCWLADDSPSDSVEAGR